LNLKANQSGNLGFNTPFNIQANTPLTAIDTSKISFMNKDSLTIDFTVVLDSIRSKIDFDFERQAEENYELELMPGAITDFFGSQNDTMNIRLRTKEYADYGNLSMNIITSLKDYPLIVQLTSEKGEIKQELYAKEPKLMEFNHIEPTNYLVRIIFDANGNGIWDTGNYLKRIQPEKVSYYPDVIEIRANWEKNETFIISE
jgi:hypothetical protein